MKETRGARDYRERVKRDPKYKEKRNAKEREYCRQKREARKAAGIPEDGEFRGLAKKKMPPEVEAYWEKEKKFYKAKNMFYASKEGKRQNERLKVLEYQYGLLTGRLGRWPRVHDERLTYGY